MIQALTTKVQLAVAACLLIVIAGLTLALAASRVEIADLKRQASDTKAAHEQALRVAEARERQKERQIAAKHEEVQKHADALSQARTEAAEQARRLAALAVERARARVAALGPRGAAGPGIAAGMRDATAGGGIRAPGQGPGPAGAGGDAEEAARMYADLFGWAVTRLAVVGDFADRAWIAADTCQRAYEAVRAASEDEPGGASP